MDSTQNIMRKLKIIIGINGCISFLILLCCNTMVARYVHSLQDVTLNFMIALIMILSYASLSLIIFLIFVLIPFVIDVSKDQDERNSAIHGYLNMCNKINKFMSSQSLFKNIIDFSLIIGSIFCSLAVFHAWWWESQICMISFSLIAAILLIITVIECGTSILLYSHRGNAKTRTPKKENTKSKIKVLLFINFCFCCIIGLVLAIFLSSYWEQNLISYTTYLIIKVISSIYFLVSVGAFIKYVYLPTAFAFNKEAIKKQHHKKNTIQDDADDIYRMK